VVTSAPIAGAAGTPAAPTTAPQPAATGYGPGEQAAGHGSLPLVIALVGGALVLGAGVVTATRRRKRA
jgi:hypothetical protein